MLKKIFEANTFFEGINKYKQVFDEYNKEKIKFKSQDGLTLDNKVINELGKLQKKMEEKHAKSKKPLEIADIHKSYLLTAHIIREFMDDMFLIEEKVLNGSSSFENNVLKRKSKLYALIEDMIDTQKHIFKSGITYNGKILFYHTLEEKKKKLLISIVKHSFHLIRVNLKPLLESLYEEENNPIRKGRIGFLEGITEEEDNYKH